MSSLIEFAPYLRRKRATEQALAGEARAETALRRARIMKQIDRLARDVTQDIFPRPSLLRRLEELDKIVQLEKGAEAWLN